MTRTASPLRLDRDEREAEQYARLIARATALPAIPTVVVRPCDQASLEGAIDAAEAGVIVPVQVGPEPTIRSVADEHGLDVSPFEIVHAVQTRCIRAWRRARSLRFAPTRCG